tara:strand:- start:202 stop:381 length:180 start_codon:yes stop_codon:yes gene_type:complete
MPEDIEPTLQQQAKRDAVFLEIKSRYSFSDNEKLLDFCIWNSSPSEISLTAKETSFNKS